LDEDAEDTEKGMIMFERIAKFTSRLKFALALSMTIFIAPFTCLLAVDASVHNMDYNYALPTPTPCIHTRGELLSYLPKHGIVAEIGVQRGEFANLILQITEPKHLYLIDCWERQDNRVYCDTANDRDHDEFYNHVKSMFASNPNVTILRMYSDEAVKLFQDERFDWIYLDANHCYESVAQDLVMWWPKIKAGGFFCGHDYVLGQGFGVHEAVNEFLDQQQLPLHFLTTGDFWESWGIKKGN
jgi:hypothetical protein